MTSILATEGPSVWSRYTNYTGAGGLHSENNYLSLTKNSSFEKQLTHIMDVISKLHQKDLKQHDKSRRKLEQSLLAYSQKMKQANREKLSRSISHRLKDIPEVDSAKSTQSQSEGSQQVDLTTKVSSPGRPSTPHAFIGNGILFHRLLPILPIQGRQTDRKMTLDGVEASRDIAHLNTRLRGHSIAIPHVSKAEKSRRKAVVTPPNINKLIRDENERDKNVIIKEDRNGELQLERKVSQTYTLLVDVGGPNDPLKPAVTITPFPECQEEKQEVEERSDSTTSKSSYSTTPSPRPKNYISTSPRPKRRKSKNKKHSNEETFEPEMKEEAETFTRESLVRSKSYAKIVAMHKKQMQEQERIALIHKKQIELEKKNRKHVIESFRYSVAMDELLDRHKLKPISNSTVSKIEKDHEGREIRIMGPAVLTSVNKDDIDQLVRKPKSRRHTTAGMKERSFVRMHSRNSIASLFPQNKEELNGSNAHERRIRHAQRQISSKLLLPTIEERKKQSKLLA